MEFPTDAKFSNVQIVPSGNKTLYLNNLPADVNSILEKNGENWTVPYELIPENYARIKLNEDLTFDSVIFAKNIDNIRSGDTYTLKLHGVYRFICGNTEIIFNDIVSSSTTEDDKFYNRPSGYEIKKSVDNDGNNVFTISPKIAIARTINIGNAKFVIELD